MANVIKTVITYPLNGSTRDFNIPFEYLARKFVQVTLIGRDRKPLTNIDDYRFTSKNQITTNRAWGTGDGYQLIELRRFTSATERLVDFSDGSILRAYDLNVSQIQTLHVAEEARDLTADTIGVNSGGDLDARGRRIVNLADPVNDLDAVNLKTIKEWNNGAYQSYQNALAQAQLAETYRNNAYQYMQAAEASKNAAYTSEQNAKASENNAAFSRDSASASASSASASAGAASTSAGQAVGAKDYCLQQADRAYSEAERAKGYADDMGHAIDIGTTIHAITGNSVAWKGNHEFTQFVSAKSSLTEADPNIIQLEARHGAEHFPNIAVSKNGGWYYYGFDLSNAGTIATQPWMQAAVQWYINDKTTTIRAAAPVGTPTNAMSVNMAGFSYWDQNQNLLSLHYQTANNLMVMRKNSDYYTPLRFEYNAVLGAVGAIEWSTDVNGRPLNITFWNEQNGVRTSNVTLPISSSGTIALQDWTRSNTLYKQPYARHIWSGNFGNGNKDIYLPESIIGKYIMVQAVDRGRLETIHIVANGAWATGRGSSVNMFTVQADGRTLHCDYEDTNGRWQNIWILE